MKYYKIVSYYNSQFFSYAVYAQYCIEYCLNKWVEPKIGKIFIFNSLENAIKFLSKEGYVQPDKRLNMGYAIFECEAEDVEELSEMAYTNTESIESYWHVGISKKNTPEGTLGASKIKLIQKVM